MYGLNKSMNSYVNFMIKSISDASATTTPKISWPRASRRLTDLTCDGQDRRAGRARRRAAPDLKGLA
jgi:hypothetical protein